MKIKKSIRGFLSANLILLAVFAFLPIFAIKPDAEILQSVLEYLNRD